LEVGSSLFKEASNCSATQIAITALAEVANAPSNEPSEKQVNRAILEFQMQTL
jgi:hypothetical protein